MHFVTRSLTTAVVFLVLGLWTAVASGAETYKSGDEIEVFFLGEWRKGIVVATNQRGEVSAEFRFGASSQRRTFLPLDVRLAYESGALARARMWSDMSGKFRVKAALLSVDDKEVTLRKQDMTEIKVALDQLSEGDRQYLTRLQKEGGPGGGRPPEPPPPEQFEGGQGFGSPLSWSWSNSRSALEPDPLPAYLKLKQGGVGFFAEDFFDRMGAVLPVGASDAWLLAAVENETPGSPLPTRVLWASLARQKIERRQLLPPSERVLDYHAPSHRLLTYNEIKENRGGWGEPTLTLWETTPTDKQIKPMVRWYAATEKGHLRYDPWARLLSGNLVIHRADSQRYVVFDSDSKRVVYQVTQESFFAPVPALSGGRKYLFLPEDKGVRVLEAATGKYRTTLPATDGVSAVAVSEDGRQAAVLGASTLNVWDLTSASAEPQTYQAESIGTPFTSTLAWVGNQRIMANEHNGQGLYSLKNKMTIWHYEFDMNAVSEHFGGRVREIVDRHLVYAATFGNAGQHGLAVGAVLLPGPGVDEAETALDKELLYVVKPGTPVSLVVNCGEYTDRVQKALEAKMQANGWTLAPAAKVTLVAEMKQGKNQTVTYRRRGLGQADETETVSIMPHFSSLKLKIGDATAWESWTSSGAPPVVWLREGQTVQGEVDRWQHPRPEFFSDAKIPDRILDPKYRDGLGTTLVTNRGLIPKGK